MVNMRRGSLFYSAGSALTTEECGLTAEALFGILVYT